MSLDIAVLYRWPDGTSIVRALTVDAHRWLAAQIRGGPDHKYELHLTRPIWFFLAPDGKASTALRLFNSSLRYSFDYWGAARDRSVDQRSWHRFVLDTFGTEGAAKAMLFEMLFEITTPVIFSSSVREKGTPTVDVEIHRLLGINPLLLPLIEFLPWWRNLQATGGAP